MITYVRPVDRLTPARNADTIWLPRTSVALDTTCKYSHAGILRITYEEQRRTRNASIVQTNIQRLVQVNHVMFPTQEDLQPYRRTFTKYLIQFLRK